MDFFLIPFENLFVASCNNADEESACSDGIHPRPIIPRRQKPVMNSSYGQDLQATGGLA